MPYASGRVIHDADAHIMEVPGFLEEHLEAKYRGHVGDSVLFPRRDGFHSHLKDAHKDGAGGADSTESPTATGAAAPAGNVRPRFAATASTLSRPRS